MTHQFQLFFCARRFWTFRCLCIFVGPALVITFVFLIVVYLLATKTVLGKFVFYFLKCVMWFPIIAGMLFYHVCIAIPLFKFRSRSAK